MKPTHKRQSVLCVVVNVIISLLIDMKTQIEISKSTCRLLFFRTNYRNGKISLKQQRTALTDRFNWPIQFKKTQITKKERKGKKKERPALHYLVSVLTNKLWHSINKSINRHPDQ